MKHMKFRWLSVFLAAVLLLNGAAQAVAGQGWLAPESGQTVEVNHALGSAATTNDAETDYWGADKAVDGIVNREETNKQNQSRWSTNGARTFEEVQKKDKILTIDMGKVQSFDRLELSGSGPTLPASRLKPPGMTRCIRCCTKRPTMPRWNPSPPPSLWGRRPPPGM